jgi:hypothetical protein
MGPVTSLLVDSTEDPLVGRVLVTLLAMQRYSWEQGVASHALLDLGQDALVELMARDDVTHQRRRRRPRRPAGAGGERLRGGW